MTDSQQDTERTPRSDWVNGWEVRVDKYGAHVICGEESVVRGPFPSREQALAAAIRLPVANGVGSTPVERLMKSQDQTTC